jgi:hypothetical protein
VMTIGASRHASMAVIRRVGHTPALSFGPPGMASGRRARRDLFFRDRAP